jgi:hypothetical protein
MWCARRMLSGLVLVFATAVGLADVSRAVTGGPPAGEGEAAGLTFRLSEGTETGGPKLLVARPAAEPLSEADARRVLDRLPPLTAGPSEEPFAMREASLPPPRTGRTVGTAFPPESAAVRPQPAPSGPLEIVRRVPEGDVPLAPRLSITFSQPMVALDTRDHLSRAAAPARLTPQPPGEWRWVGTRTLLFEPLGRFPMATEFHVEVPAGVRSATGGTLPDAVGWSFATPPPRLLAGHPVSGPARRDALMFAAFDQRVDAATVLQSVRVRAQGADVTVRLASADEVAADATVARLAGQAEAGRGLAFRAERDLPPDAGVTVTLGAGTPSAEGPRRTAAPLEWSFRTYGAFRVRRHECGGRDRCTPFDPWRVELTNPLDVKRLRKENVHVEPELPGMKVEAWGSTLAIRGAARGRTTYRVTPSSAIVDVFGQRLQPGAALAFDVGPAPAVLFAPGGDFVVLDPSGGPRFPVHSVNYHTLRVRAYAVGPEDWGAWQSYLRERRGEASPTPPGVLALDTTVQVGGEPDTLTETRIDLAPAFRGGLGQVVLLVRPTSSPRERRGDEVPPTGTSTRAPSCSR